MKPFDIQDPELKVHRPFLLEASAGTGKTYSIENIVVRALLEDPKKGPLSLSDILVVTFTKAAAKELKIRILQSLQKKSDLPRIKRALVEFDSANIFTIHGFCYRALLEHAPSFRLNSDPEELSQDKIWRVIENHFRTEFFYTAEQIAILLKPHRNDITSLVKALIKIQGTGIPFGKSISNDEAFFALKDFSIDRFLPHAENYLGILDKNGNVKIHNLAELLPLFAKSNLKKNKNPACADDLDALQKKFLPFIRALYDYDTLFSRLASECQKAIHDEFERSETADFSYLLLKMQKLVQTDPDFKQRVKNAYRMVIIDEFQDTDPVQWQIFKTLFQHPQFPLILVGDPKQSIYAFRNADIYTYLDAASCMESKYLLNTNYRSSYPLVSALNKLFENAPGFISLPYLKKGLPYVPVLSPHEKKEGKALHFLLVSSSDKLDEIEEKFLFPEFLEEIIHLKIPLSKIAILVRDQAQSNRVLKYFQSKNLPIIQKKPVNLDKSKVFLDFIYLFQAILNPKRLNLIQIALGTCFFKGTAEPETMIPQFVRWNLLWKEKGIASVFESVSENSFLSDDLFHEARQIVEWISLKEKEEALLPEQAVELLESDFEHPLRPLAGTEAVQILTLHMSKGLEFEAVFALGVVNRTQKPSGLIQVREGFSRVLKAADEATQEFIEELDAEKARQLYVAFTRAKSHLYVPVIEGWKPPSPGTASPLELFLAKLNIPIEGKYLEPKTGAPYIPPPLPELIPPPPLFINFPKLTSVSFSSLSKKNKSTQKLAPHDFNALFKSPHTLPAGAYTGDFLHQILENGKWIPNTPFEPWKEIILSMVHSAFHSDLGGFTLNDVTDSYKEMEFVYPVENGMMTGVIDLFFRYENKFYLLDWKSNWLGEDASFYNEENLKQEMKKNQYDLQADIYKTALQKYLAKIVPQPFEDIFGGVIYFFLRGKTAYVTR